MPTTPGIMWQKQGAKFKKSSLAKGVSFAQIQWLNYVQETDFCRDSSGKKIQIEHAYFRGEKKEGDFYIDGYFVKDNQKIYLEFLGCYEGVNLLSLFFYKNSLS